MPTRWSRWVVVSGRAGRPVDIDVLVDSGVDADVTLTVA
jgi:hypothetical protein